ncbi:HD domain-containing protein, partial [bacterium]|nr:HD domain-containing protein [bacterium]
LGVLGRLIPEFGRINNFVYYDNFHKYTADEHTLLTLRSLDDLLTANEPALKELSDMLHTIPHIHILRLALLLHDLGKVYGPYHSKKSAEMVPRISKRMGLDGDQISLIEFLVRNHIVMSNFIQTRDLDDDDSIGEFANIAATPRRLSMLYILTYCDIHAVAPNVWSDWKHSLLWNLFRKTLNYITLEEFAEKRVEYFSALREDIIDECSDEFSLDEIEEHLNNIHEKYIFTTSPSVVKIHLRLIREAKNNTFAINVVRKEKTGLTEFTFCSTIDKIGLLSEIMGTLTLRGLNILSAKVFTRSDGIALDKIIIVGLVEDAVWEEVDDSLKRALMGNESIDAQVRGHRKFLKITGKKKLTIRTKVTFNNKTSHKFTIIEIETQDRIGLLYLITRALSDLSLNIAFAKIFTEGDKALDVFYVTDEKKNKISSKRKLEKIKKTLSGVLSMQFNKN